MFKNPDDKNEVLVSVIKDGATLEFASDRLKSDIEVVAEAVKNHSWNIIYADESLVTNKDFLFEIKNIILENKDSKLYEDFYFNLVNFENEMNFGNKVFEKKYV